MNDCSPYFISSSSLGFKFDNWIVFKKTGWMGILPISHNWKKVNSIKSQLFDKIYFLTQIGKNQYLFTYIFNIINFFSQPLDEILCILFENIQEFRQ